MVLASGILVDGAIVVVENVERLIGRGRALAERGNHKIDEPNHRRFGRHRAGVVRCLCSDGFLWWLNRSHLSSILDHHRLGDDTIRTGRDHLHSGPLCNPFAAGQKRAPGKEAWVLWVVQPRIRRWQPRAHVRRRLYHRAWRPALCDLSGGCWSHGLPLYPPPLIVSPR